MLSDRYARNLGALSEAEMAKLRAASACVVGLGGLGGHVAMQLARLGIGRLVLVDHDRFQESNLNRQLFATEANLGESKAREAARALATVNSGVACRVVEERLEVHNALRILSDCDIAIDALDNLGARLVLESACEEAGIPLVHGAVGEWVGQVTTVYPGDRSLSLLYAEAPEPDPPSVLAFVPAAVAGFEVAEAVKVLLSREGTLRRRLLLIDFLAGRSMVVELG